MAYKSTLNTRNLPPFEREVIELLKQILAYVESLATQRE